jgi:hypothetical protein
VHDRPPLQDTHGFSQNPVSDPLVNPLSGHNVDLAAEPFGKAASYACEVEQVELGRGIIIDDDIDIARRLGVATGNGAEHIESGYAAGSQRTSFRFDQASYVIGCHHRNIAQQVGQPPASAKVSGRCRGTRETKKGGPWPPFASLAIAMPQPDELRAVDAASKDAAQ